MKTTIYKTILFTAILVVMGCKDKTATVIESAHNDENENVIELTDAQLAQTD